MYRSQQLRKEMISDELASHSKYSSFSEQELRFECLSVFKLSGLNLQPDAMRLVINSLLSITSREQRARLLNMVVEFVLKQNLSSCSVGKAVIDRALKQRGCNDDENLDLFSVINVFDAPKFKYVPEKRKFRRCISKSGAESGILLGSVNDRINIFRDRFGLILQKVQRHELFTPSIMNDEARFQLRTVENLLSEPESNLKNCICLAMLVRLKESKLYLEDLTGHVEIDTSDATFQSGIFTENCIVLAEGCFSEGIFQAKAIGLPPIEDAQKTRDFFGPINFFGSSAKQCVKSLPKLVEMERNQQSAAFVILSDVWLDDNLVLEKLRQLFNGFSNSPPTCFMICGRFLSRYESGRTIGLLKDGFKALVDLILEFPKITQQSHFIFVPSLQDHLLNGLFPNGSAKQKARYFCTRKTPPLPSAVLSNILSKIPHHHLATNPCRIQFLSHEIVIFREDIIEKMCRNCIKVPTDVKKLHHHNHLCPLPLNVSPIYWPFDYSMQLHPIPDLIICCDKYMQYTEKFHDCVITNPGSFSTSKFIFQVYYPASKNVDDSSLPEE